MGSIWRAAEDTEVGERVALGKSLLSLECSPEPVAQLTGACSDFPVPSSREATVYSLY